MVVPLQASQSGELPFLFFTSTLAPQLRISSTNLKWPLLEAIVNAVFPDSGTGKAFTSAPYIEKWQI